MANPSATNLTLTSNYDAVPVLMPRSGIRVIASSGERERGKKENLSNSGEGLYNSVDEQEARRFIRKSTELESEKYPICGSFSSCL